MAPPLPSDDEPDPPDVMAAWAVARSAFATLVGTVGLRAGYTTPGEWLAVVNDAAVALAVALDLLYQATGGDALALALVRADLRATPDGHQRGGRALELGALLFEVYALTTGRDLGADVQRWQMERGP